MGVSKHLVGAAAVVLLGTAVAGLMNRDEPSPSGPTGPGAVEIVAFAFGPETMAVPAGTTITWTNRDTTAHTVDSVSGDELNSDSIAEGTTFDHTFNTPGTYTYFCAFHPFMKGTVEVTG